MRRRVRVAVVDIGTNSTRLLIADVEPDGSVVETHRESIVTRLGEGVDATGRLGDEPTARVFAALDRYAAEIAAHECEASAAVMTSAVRDAANGATFAATVRDRFGLEGRTLSGDEEAAYTYAGATATATAARPPDDPTERVVIDIGGGSTELVCGARGRLGFHVSTQIGVVRHSERHLPSDPPTTAELEPYDTSKVEGHVLSHARLEQLLTLLAALPVAARRRVRGLNPDRAPTIVAGVVILIGVLDAFGLGAVEISDRDILWGVAIDLARA